jgi:hypothetical protein
VSRRRASVTLHRSPSHSAGRIATVRKCTTELPLAATTATVSTGRSCRPLGPASRKSVGLIISGASPRLRRATHTSRSAGAVGTQVDDRTTSPAFGDSAAAIVSLRLLDERRADSHGRAAQLARWPRETPGRGRGWPERRPPTTHTARGDERAPVWPLARIGGRVRTSWIVSP